VSKKLTVLSFSMVSGLLVLSSSAQATTYDFTSIIDPNATNGYNPAGINNSGHVVGGYTNSSNSGLNLVSTNFHGSYFDGSSYTTIDANFSIPNNPYYLIHSSGTYLSGINNSNAIVGFQINDDNYSSFEYKSGAFTTIDVPNAISYTTKAYGINDNGDIVGSYRDINGTHGFVYNSSLTAFTTIDDPKATGFTEIFGINNHGDLVGRYYDFPAGSIEHGFLYSGSQFTTIDDPNTAITSPGSGNSATGINNAGDVVGTYVNQTGGHGFLYKNGSYTTIDNPALTIWGNDARGINDYGQIVLNHYSQGSIATPASVPVPAAAWLFGTGLLGFLGMRRSNKIG
jgi:probable HAF family extracellular repeat protein